MATDMRQMGPDFRRRSDEMARAMDAQIPRYVGNNLVQGFRKSFTMQRFNDDTSPQWKEVRRREPKNPWYGFNYRSNYPVPVGMRGTTAKGKPKRYGTHGGRTNFTPTATTRSILFGWGSQNLRESIYLYYAGNGRIVVASDQAHAQVHNEGLTARIFGRKEFRMPRRQFMGTSHRLNRQNRDIIERVFNKIMQQ